MRKSRRLEAGLRALRGDAAHLQRGRLRYRDIARDGRTVVEVGMKKITAYATSPLLYHPKLRVIEPGVSNNGVRACMDCGQPGLDTTTGGPYLHGRGRGKALPPYGSRAWILSVSAEDTDEISLRQRIRAMN
jgi:hypothetical protein